MTAVNLLERTFAFACSAVDLYRHLMKTGGAGRSLARQFLDAATSIGANEEEAQASASRADFLAKQSTVLKEARESYFWLRLFERTGIDNPALVQPLRREAGELVAIFTVIVRNARTNASA